MSSETVDEAVEAGARALADPVADVHHEFRMDATDWVPYCICGWQASEPYAVAEYDEHLSAPVIKAVWPVLSAGLRELHTRWDQGGGWVVCMHCNDNTSPPRKKQWPCETITALDRINQELGISPERAAPCPDHRPVQHRDARPPWCNTCGLTKGGEVPTGPLDRGNRSRS